MRCAPWAVGLNPVATGLGIRPGSAVWLEVPGSSERAGPGARRAPVSFCVHMSVSVCEHLDPGHTSLHQQIYGRTGLTASFPARVLTLETSRWKRGEVEQEIRIQVSIPAGPPRIRLHPCCPPAPRPASLCSTLLPLGTACLV